MVKSPSLVFDPKTSPDISSEFPEIHRRLEFWFEENARKLPWRKNPRPYSVWISEIMLQQTKAETVAEYFSRWMKELPTVQKLAKTESEKVFKLWEGLGYYNRCKNICSTARILVEKKNGEFPQTNEELQKLPGIGEYTAGAILNIAFQIPSGMVDGNISRVLSRLLDCPLSIETTAARKFFYQAVHTLCRLGNSRALSQSLMELGAVICKPKNPDCLLCPVNSLCKALQNKTLAERPVRQPRTKAEPLILHHYVIESPAGFLMKKAKKKEWWSGLWCFPWLRENEKSDFTRQILQEEKQSFMSFSHGITKYKVTSRVFYINTTSPEKFINEDFEWIPKNRLAQISMSLPSVRIRKKLLLPN